MHAHFWILLLALSLVGCASTGGESLEICPSLDALQPLPGVDTCGESALLELRSRFAKTIEPEVRTLLVRVEFDESARAKSMCADRESASSRGGWGARRALAEQLSGILGSPPGPTCLASKRLDFNRYRSKLAEVERAENECGEQGRIMTESNRNSGMDPGRAQRGFSECMSHRADWILLDRIGQMRPLVFAEPEIPDGLDVRATETARRCSRTARDLDLQITCIQEDGWEFLEEPLEVMKTDGE